MTLTRPPFGSVVSRLTYPTASIQKTVIKCNKNTLAMFNIYIPPKSEGPSDICAQVTNTMWQLKGHEEDDPHDYIHHWLLTKI